MTIIRLLPVLLSALLISAHFFRSGNIGLAVVSTSAPFMLLINRRWVMYVISGLLLLGALVWIETTFAFIHIRQALGMPWLRLGAILGSVTVLTALSGLVFRKKKIADIYARAAESAIPSSAAFFLTGFILTMVQLKVKLPLLLLERFIPGGGWIEIFFLSLYAAYITEKMVDRAGSSKWRRRIWALFSIVFFGQLALGLAGAEQFLMTGKLHLPIPAMIIAGPLFRWESSIMLFLFAGALVLVGPAWCSHLCYIGAWDDAASRKLRKPKKLPAWRQPVRVAILFLVLAVAMGLRLLGVSMTVATFLGLLFGLIGVGVMLFWSRRTGAMTHCITWCPIGVLAIWLGKISPFRIRINDSCSDCGICRLSCRYDALNLADIKNRKPNISCTLCGDCIGSCGDRSIEYRFLGLKADYARTLFIVLAVSLHTVFLGLGRI
ncbi:MAG: 4Fe-4S binding protein [Candidatus Zixiibacteriota bacterium]